MTPKGRRDSKPRRILIFGEDPTDIKLIQELLIAVCPDLDGMIKPIRKPPILIRDCDPAKVPERVEIIRRLIDAEKTSFEVVCVFTHEDCDGFEPAHIELSEKIELGFAKAGYHVHAVTPAWETEAWLFLWPTAVAAYRPTWRSLNQFRGKNVGTIKDAKEELIRALRPQGEAAARTRDYRVSDAPLIARKVREMGLADKPAGKSSSYDLFREKSKECCGKISG